MHFCATTQPRTVHKTRNPPTPLGQTAVRVPLGVPPFYPSVSDFCSIRKCGDNGLFNLPAFIRLHSCIDFPTTFLFKSLCIWLNMLFFQPSVITCVGHKTKHALLHNYKTTNSALNTKSADPNGVNGCESPQSVPLLSDLVVLYPPPVTGLHWVC